MKINPSLYAFRPGQHGDAHFLLSTWLKSYRNSAFAQRISNDVYFRGHQEQIATILGIEGTAVTVVCAKDDEDQILGYVVYNTLVPILHYAYVKYPFRNVGLGSLLIKMVGALHPGQALNCTHLAKQWDSVSRKFNLLYNPYYLGVVIGQRNEGGNQPADSVSRQGAEVVSEQLPGAGGVHPGQEPLEGDEVYATGG